MPANTFDESRLRTVQRLAAELAELFSDRDPLEGALLLRLAAEILAQRARGVEPERRSAPRRRAPGRGP